jgi:hypothetical protein
MIKKVPLTISKPGEFLEKFRSKRSSTIAGVETLLTALPILRISEANDFVRVHPSEDDYWSPENGGLARMCEGEEARLPAQVLR